MSPMHPWRVPMRARSPHEPHRAATPLELLFDLVFVVAIAQAASGLHHAVAEAHIGQAITNYTMVFFGIWWAWMNFTWFASAYDCDDVLYRLSAFVQITGALVFAAGVKTMFDTGTIQATHHAHIGPTGAAFAVAIPVALYLLSLWRLHYRPGTLTHLASGPLAVILILATPFATAEFAVPVIGIILAVLLAMKIAMRTAELPAATTGEVA